MRVVIHQIAPLIGAGADATQVLFTFFDEMQQVPDARASFESRLDLSFERGNLVAEFALVITDA